MLSLPASNSPVVVCGGGNASHVLASLVAASGREVRVLSLLQQEVDRWSQSATPTIVCANDLGDDVVGTASHVASDAAQVVPGAGLIILAVPAFTHRAFLDAIAPHVSAGAIVGAMPGEGGFDIEFRAVFGVDALQNRISAFFVLETLPWACRILEYGKSVRIMGTKKNVDMCVQPQQHGEAVMQQLQLLLGRLPQLKLTPSPLSITLMNINSVWHPTITYGQFRNWDMKTPFQEAPMFYEGVDDFTADHLCAISNEVLEIRRVLEERWPKLNLSAVVHVKQWMPAAYGEDIGDTSNLKRMLQSNKGYLGLKHPMKPAPGAEGSQLFPDLSSRYLAEDVPYGIAVTRGVAELAGVPTPAIDAVILWCQKVSCKEYLVDGRLQGKDLQFTRCPQRFGFHDLATFMSAQQYV